MDDRYLKYLKEDDQLWGVEGMKNDPINQQPQQQNDPINDPINNLDKEYIKAIEKRK